MGVAKCTASRIPSIEFPDMINAKREVACGDRNIAPVRGDENTQSPIEKNVTIISTTAERRQKQSEKNYSFQRHSNLRPFHWKAHRCTTEILRNFI